MEATAESAINKNRKIQFFIFLISVIFTLVLLTMQISIRRSSYSLQVGSVATIDITAPRTVTYVSDILTEQARADAEEIVGNVFLPADPTISRNQLQNLRYTFSFINSVRLDEYSTIPQKIADINSIMFVSLDEETINQILELSDEDWQSLQDESVRVLEEVMQNSIRENQVSAEIENIPTMISYYLSPQLTSLVNIFTRKFVVANSLFSEELTEKNREDARSSVQNRERTFVANQTVIQRGQVVTELIYEALDQMGLVTSRDNRQRYFSVLSVVASMALFFIFFYQSDQKIKEIDARSSFLIAALFLGILLSARMLIPNRTILPFIFPVQALGLTISSLFGNIIGVVFAIIIGVLTPYDFSSAGGYSLYYILTAMCSIFILGKNRQITSFLYAGLAAGLIGIPLIFCIQFEASTPPPDSIGLLSFASASMINGLLSAVFALVAQYLFASLVGLTTTIQLMELLRPESPLLQQILRNAPGTYQHSLMVANLSEQAAEEIGADVLLVKTGAMYHDCGKILNPLFFVENQVQGNLNLHEDISPKDTSATIIQHVTEGSKLIRKYNIPEAIGDFVRQHHGTNVTRYQYNLALQSEDASEVNIADFTYPGPCPQSRETALVMLADSVEARARAEKPSSDAEIEALVKGVFDSYSTSGQLDNSPMTLKDMTQTRAAFIRVLRNIYHPRVKYPTANTKKKISSAVTIDDKTEA